MHSGIVHDKQSWHPHGLIVVLRKGKNRVIETLLTKTTADYVALPELLKARRELQSWENLTILWFSCDNSFSVTFRFCCSACAALYWVYFCIKNIVFDKFSLLPQLFSLIVILLLGELSPRLSSSVAKARWLSSSLLLPLDRLTALLTPTVLDALLLWSAPELLLRLSRNGNAVAIYFQIKVLRINKPIEIWLKLMDLFNDLPFLLLYYAQVRFDSSIHVTLEPVRCCNSTWMWGETETINELCKRANRIQRIWKISKPKFWKGRVKEDRRRRRRREEKGTTLWTIHSLFIKWIPSVGWPRTESCVQSEIRIPDFWAAAGETVGAGF